MLHDSPGKTRTSRRAVDLDTLTVEVLRAWRARRADESAGPVGDEDYVFATPSGEPIRPDGFSKSFDRIVASAGVPRVRLHDLRHTHASLLLKERVPIKVVSERLGGCHARFHDGHLSTRAPGHAGRGRTGLRRAHRFYRLQPGRSPPGTVTSLLQTASDHDF